MAVFVKQIQDKTQVNLNPHGFYLKTESYFVILQLLPWPQHLHHVDA